MPEKYIKYWEKKGWDAAYFKSQSEGIEENTACAISAIHESKAFIEQTYSASLGVMGLTEIHTHARSEHTFSKNHPMELHL